MTHEPDDNLSDDEPTLHEVLEKARIAYTAEDCPNKICIVFENYEDSFVALEALRPYLPVDAEIDEDMLGVPVGDAGEVKDYFVLKCPLPESTEEEQTPILVVVSAMAQKGFAPLLHTDTMVNSEYAAAQWLSGAVVFEEVKKEDPYAYVEEIFSWKDEPYIAVMYDVGHRAFMEQAIKEFEEKYQLTKPLDRIEDEEGVCGFYMPTEMVRESGNDPLQPEEAKRLLQDARRGFIPFAENVKDEEELNTKLFASGERVWAGKIHITYNPELGPEESGFLAN